MQETTSESGLGADARRRWNEDGYLLLRGVLEPGAVATLLAAVDAVLARRDVPSVTQSDTRDAEGAAYKIAQAVVATDAIDPLVDHPAVMPALLALVGPFLQVLGTEIFVRRPGPGPEPLVGWHADAGSALQRLLPNDADPVLQLKAQFFLTDCAQPDSGNFALVPGSHRLFFPGGGDAFEAPANAMQLCVQAGDVLLFPWSLWHAVAPNLRGTVRKSVTIRYGPLWARPYDYDRLPADVMRRLTPRRRRLFGDLGVDAQPWSYYYTNPHEQTRLMCNG
jgi:ectoine hydroxylase